MFCEENMKLTLKIFLFIGSTVFLGLTVAVYFITSKSFESAKAHMYSYADTLAEKYAFELKNEMESAVLTARTLSSIFKNYETLSVEERRTDILKQLKSVLESNEKYLGIWSVWEPNVLDGKDAEFINKEGHDSTGRFIPYFNRLGGIHLEPCMDYEKTDSQGDYYNIPKNTKKEFITKPTTYEINGKKTTVVSLVVPIINKGNFVGAVGIDMSMDYFQNLIEKIKFLKTGYAFLVYNEGERIAHPKKELIGRVIGDDVPKQQNELLEAVKNGKKYTMTKISLANGKESLILYTPIQIGEFDKKWSLGIAITTDEIMYTSYSIRNISVITGIIIFIVLLIVIYFITNYIVGKINATTNILKDISQGDGDLTVKLPETEKGDELNELSHWFNIFVEKIRGIVEEISNQSKILASSSEELNISSKEMTNQIETTNKETKEANNLIENANEKGQSIASAVEENTANINDVTKLTNKVNDYFKTVEKNSNQLREMVLGVSAALEEMNATIGEITKNTATAANTSIKTANQAQESEEKMEYLTKSALEIGSVVELIKDIAEQTNLLALNATIEAARAGEAGKGFSVVANEIKNLAKQTAEATIKITEQVNTIQANTNHATTSIKAITKQITDLNEISNSIASAVEEQAATVGEVTNSMNQTSSVSQSTINSILQISSLIDDTSKNLKEVNQGSGIISNSISHIALSLNEIKNKSNIISKSNNESSTSSSQVSQLSNDLSNLAANLKSIVDKFKI